MPSPVRLAYTKYDGSLHWHSWMWRLGSDAHGIWLGAPAGSPARRGIHGPTVAIPTARVTLIPSDRWFTADFHAAPAHYWLYCDVTTVPAWPRPDLVTMVDLDLDVGASRAGPEPFMMDEDEFAMHIMTFRYPPAVVDRARSSAAWLCEAVAAGRAPFYGVAEGWLDQIPTTSDLPFLDPPEDRLWLAS